MFGSYWRVIPEAARVFAVAAVLAFAIAIALPHLVDAVWADNEQQQTQNKQRPPIDWTPGRSGKKLDQNPREYRADCTSPQDREEADLCQQWRVAEATEETAALTRRQTLMNFLQTSATILAALATAWAAVAAASAARSARETIEHGETTAERELRPYVHCDRFITSLNRPVTKPEAFDTLILQVEWVNFGKTPARRVNSALNWYFFFDDGTPERLSFRDLFPISPHAQTLGPQQKYYTRTRPIPMNVAVRAWQRRIQLIYWGWIEYEGLGEEGVRHRTEVCAVLMPLGDPRRQETHYSNTWITRFNAADDDCVHETKT